jgi:hypothetical protein
MRGFLGVLLWPQRPVKSIANEETIAMCGTQTCRRERLSEDRHIGLSRRSVVRALGGGVAAGAALGGFSLARPEEVVAKVRQRSLKEWLAAQGSTTYFAPPVPDCNGWFPQFDAVPFNFALVDYAGVVAKFLKEQHGIDLKTKSSGKVLERSLADGRAEVTVVVQTSNALSWALEASGDTDINEDPLHFGVRPLELAAEPSLRPALGQCVFRHTFLNAAPGDPLPDFGAAFHYGDDDLYRGDDLLALDFHSLTIGNLRAASGFPEGTKGRLTVKQVARFDPCVGDCYPVENVDIQRLGQGLGSARAASAGDDSTQGADRQHREKRGGKDRKGDGKDRKGGNQRRHGKPGR